MADQEGRFELVEEVAERLLVDVQTVRRWIKSGRLKAYKPGREYRILSSDLDEFLEARSSPKVQAPLPLDADAKAGLSSLTDIPQDEFLRTLSSAVSDEALLELFGRMDAERTHLELAFRDDEGDSKARNTFARAVQRRMMVFLTLVERGIAPPDPEKIRLAEQLDNVLRSSR